MASQTRNIEYRRKKNSSKHESFFTRHRIGISILIFVFGLILTLSILSYSPKDQANLISISEIGKILTGDEQVRQKLERTHNWLGFFGAKISFFLINYTFGYASVFIGLILMLWGVFLFFNKDKHLFFKWSFYLLFFSFILSVFLGNLKLIFGTEEFKSEICGVVGLYVADVLIKLFGEFGSILITLILFLVFLGFIFEINFYDIAISIGGKVSAFLSRLKFKPRRKPSDVKILKPEQKRVEEQVEIVISKPEPETLKIERVKEEGVTEKVQIVSKEEQKRQQVRKLDFKLPPIELLDPPDEETVADDEELNLNAELLRNKLANFDIEVEKISITPGPVVTLYEIVPAADVKVREIVSLADDIALALAARGIRVIAPMPGKGTVGIEIPNRKPMIVKIRSVIGSPEFKNFSGVLPIAMGKTITGEVYCDDLARMPHLLIGGATGSGKSVGINTIIISLLYKLKPSEI
ncbi:MAG: DNA translocase FtsK 4TM domain-containing protein, partial [Candidatus Kryptonium sp.]